MNTFSERDGPDMTSSRPGGWKSDFAQAERWSLWNRRVNLELTINIMKRIFYCISKSIQAQEAS